MSREYSELKFAGSLNKNDDFSSRKIGLLGVEHKEDGRCTTFTEFSKYLRYNSSRLLSISTRVETL